MLALGIIVGSCCSFPFYVSCMMTLSCGVSVALGHPCIAALDVARTYYL